jgi:UMF1 family MFS transporter
MYDWANSAFTTIVVTFIYATYFTRAFAPDEVTGTAYWSRAVALSAIIIALLSPLVGAMADRGGRRRSFLLISTLICVGGTASLAFISPAMENAVLLALALFVVANVAFEVGGVFYNSFLPDVSPPGRIGTISGLGWGVGYTAGIVSMIVALLAFVGFGGGDAWLGLSEVDGWNVRAVNLLVAGWFLLFSIPMFLFVKDEGAPKKALRVGEAFGELRTTLRELRKFREIVKFLVARLVYNDGLVTVFAFGGIYAQGTFGFEMSEVIVFGIVLNIVAGLGAFLFGFIDDRVGGKKTVMISLVALSAATLLGVFAPNRLWFWVAGVGIGMFAGPNQAASRSLMGRFVPHHRQAEFFGFFQFSGKITAFMGPLRLGFVSELFGSQRPGVATVAILFLTGGIILKSVNEVEGIRAATEDSAGPA